MTETSGAYVSTMEMDPTLEDHTVYRPVNLAKVDGKLPIVVFGNGGCINIGSLFKPLLGEVASHGYLVVATGPIGPEPEMPSRQSGERPALVQSKVESLTQAIDWAIAENERKGSAYFQRLDTSAIAVAGQSCGGLQAIKIGADPRIATVLVLNSGIIRGGIPNPDGSVRQPAGVLPAEEADLANLHTPVLYLIGGETDQAHRGSEADFDQIAHVPVFNANLPVGHGGTWRKPQGGEMGEVVVSWLDWRLKGSASASLSFVGEDCKLCTNSEWTVKRKNWN